MFRQRTAALAAAVLMAATAIAPAVWAADAPTTWDGLVKVESKRMQAVYLLPGADFRPYTKVMIDPAQVAFVKNWARDYNSSTRSTTNMIRKSDTDRIVKRASEGFDKIIAKAFTDAGYQIVTEAGDDVLRLSPGVLNLAVSAPDLMTAGRTRSFAADAGEATVVIEARDSATGALIGRALDRREAGWRTGSMNRNSVTNTRDFEILFKRWADTAVDGIATLKSLSPIDAAGQPPPQ